MRASKYYVIIVVTGFTFFVTMLILSYTNKVYYHQILSYVPERWHPDCIPLHFQTDEQSHPVIALASIPGSGNTWTRHLIHQATDRK